MRTDWELIDLELPDLVETLLECAVNHQTSGLFHDVKLCLSRSLFQLVPGHTPHTPGVEVAVAGN